MFKDKQRLKDFLKYIKTQGQEKTLYRSLACDKHKSKGYFFCFGEYVICLVCKVCKLNNKEVMLLELIDLAPSKQKQSELDDIVDSQKIEFFCWEWDWYQKVSGANIRWVKEKEIKLMNEIMSNLKKGNIYFVNDYTRNKMRDFLSVKMTDTKRRIKRKTQQILLMSTTGIVTGTVMLLIGLFVK